MTAIPFGLGSTGFVPKTTEDAAGELEADLQAAFGVSIDLTPQSVFGQFVGIMSDRFGSLWSLGQAINAAQDPDAATDAALDGVCAITGTQREPARRSTTTLTVTGTHNTFLTAGRVVSVVGTGTKFQTNTSVIISAGNSPSWVAGSAHVVGDRVSSLGFVWLCYANGVAGPPPGNGVLPVPGNPLWRQLGAGNGCADVGVTAQIIGPVLALSGTLTVIETPVSGWNGAYNVLDAIAGANVEGDPSLRLRRVVELQGDSDATLAAIRANVLRVDQNTDTPVVACTVFQNTTMVTDVNGLPPKSVEVLVQGGLDIFQAVLDSVAGGIETYGNQSTVINDAGGNPQTVKFSRPNALDVYVVVDVDVDPALFPVAGDSLIAAAIGALVYPIGKGVSASAVAAPVWTAAPGVLSVGAPLPFIGLAPAPVSSANIVAGNHDRAVFDSSRVTVNVHPMTEGSP